MKRIFALSWFWSLIIVLVAGVAWEILLGRMPVQAASEAPARSMTLPLVMATSVVLFVFLVDIGVLWSLTRLGGKLGADVRATVKKFGGSLMITTAGLLGSFMAVAVMAFGAIYGFTKLLA